jgi:hypothetical protein
MSNGCKACRRTFTVRPPGVTQSSKSKRTRALAVQAQPELLETTQESAATVDRRVAEVLQRLRQ